MTFSDRDLIKIGRLFNGRDGEHDTAEIAEIIGCDEEDIYNALNAARDAYRKYNRWHREHQQSVRNRVGARR
ncbi:MAG: hypothetical protein BGO05_18590 [Rhizobiales bacterium 63-7]|nr:hypothetical protein [Hyphomicrobiales bacterium]OJU65896.1 MAG: hypothetical protein BGO05_18590 [Rhizobiales bacterium 63-7]